MPVETAMMSVVAQAPYRMCKRLSGALSNHGWRNGTRLGRCESTRSITTLRGQGRKTVRTASKIIAKPAQHSGTEKGRRSGRKLCTQTLLVCRAELSSFRLLPVRWDEKRKIEFSSSSFDSEVPSASLGDFN